REEENEASHDSEPFISHADGWLSRSRSVAELGRTAECARMLRRRSAESVSITFGLGRYLLGIGRFARHRRYACVERVCPVKNRSLGFIGLLGKTTLFVPLSQQFSNPRDPLFFAQSISSWGAIGSDLPNHISRRDRGEILSGIDELVALRSILL